MDANTFARPASHQVLTILIFTLLAISNLSAACVSTTIPFNSTQANYQNTTIPSNYTQNNYQNNTIPSNYTQTSYQNTTIPSTYTQTSYQNSTIHSNYTQTYIKTSCNSTTYPSICYQSLYPYALKIEADPLKLCNNSLSLALEAAYGASSTTSKLLENNNFTRAAEQVVQDCYDNVKESIGELQDSLDAMGHLDDIDKDFQMSNIKTWVSAAITDDQTCSDGFDEANVDGTARDKIRKNILNVARMTSNALYFINNLSY